MQWLRLHAAELEPLGREAGRIAAHVLIGMVLGALISLRDAVPMQKYLPLAKALAGRTARLGQAFRSVVFEQVKIAALNALFAWAYLEVVLPLAGVHLPLRKTMVALTFVTGLIPVAGKLISNTIIIVLSLGSSVDVALASFLFLVVIHKLEYFLNTRSGHRSVPARGKYCLPCYSWKQHPALPGS